MGNVGTLKGDSSIISSRGRETVMTVWDFAAFCFQFTDIPVDRHSNCGHSLPRFGGYLHWRRNFIGAAGAASIGLSLVRIVFSPQSLCH